MKNIKYPYIRIPSHCMSVQSVGQAQALIKVSLKYANAN